MPHHGAYMRAGSPYAVAIYCGDTHGLGHIRRSVTIASRLVADRPGTRVLLFTGLPSGCFFELPDGVDFIKLPAVRKIANGTYRPRTLATSQDELIRLRAAVIREALATFHPDLFLIDHMPAGIGGELLPTLRALVSRPNPPAVVLGLRDVLDEPRVVRNLWREQGIYATINEFFDSVMIYGCEQVFDAKARYCLDRYLTTDVSYCGYVRSPLEGNPSRERSDEGERIVITGGGGADGFPMMKICLEAVARLRHRSTQVVCVTGPFMSSDRRQALRELSKDLPAQLFWQVGEERRCMAAADLVITMAGYNTLIESIGLGKRILTIPRRGPSAEQALRSELFAARGLCGNIDLDSTSPARLARRIEESLDAETPVAKLPEMDGLAVVAGKLESLMKRRVLRDLHDPPGPRRHAAGVRS